MSKEENSSDAFSVGREEADNIKDIDDAFDKNEYQSNYQKLKNRERRERKKLNNDDLE